MTTEARTQIADSSEGFSPQANAEGMPLGTAERSAADADVATTGQGQPARPPAERQPTQHDLNRLRSVYDQQIAALQAQLAATALEGQDQAFERGVQAQGLEGEDLARARQAYLGQRQMQISNLQLRQQAEALMAMQQAVDADGNAIGKAKMIEHFSRTWGVDPEALKAAKSPEHFFQLAAENLARKMRNGGRDARVDRGGAGAGGVDVNKLSPFAKLRLGLEQRATRGR